MSAESASLGSVGAATAPKGALACGDSVVNFETEVLSASARNVDGNDLGRDLSFLFLSVDSNLARRG